MIKISKGTKLQEHVNMERYMKELPGIFNAYYKTNLLDIIDELPQQPKRLGAESVIFKTNISSNTKNQSFNSNAPIQNYLTNVVFAFKHECDGLGNDIQVNSYQIMKAFLGKGAHSFVKQAKKQGKIYAIKIISFDKLKKKYYIKDNHITKMINCEINLLNKLKSSHIIGFQQAIYSIEKQRIFIVLEYCSKGTLLKIISGASAMPINQWHKKAKKYFIQMAKGLLKMHENNVIHRDMKSENVLVNEADEIKIIDFNVSSQVPSNGIITISDKFVGTKTYAPPQLVLPNSKPRQVDGRLIDIWALGVTFWELWERKHPFNVNSVEQLVKLLQNPVVINKGYDPDLRNLLQRMLHHENKERITASDILKHPWVLKQLN